MKMKISTWIANALRRKQSAMINGPVAFLGIVSKVPLAWLRIPDWLNVCLNDDKEGLNSV